LEVIIVITTITVVIVNFFLRDLYYLLSVLFSFIVSMRTAIRYYLLHGWIINQRDQLLRSSRLNLLVFLGEINRHILIPWIQYMLALIER